MKFRAALPLALGALSFVALGAGQARGVDEGELTSPKAPAVAKRTSVGALGVVPLPATTAGVRAPAPARSRSPAADLERVIASIDREERTLRARLTELGREAAIVQQRTLARGRAYTRLARAGLLPVGDGFDSLAEHAARLERLYQGLSQDLRTEKRLSLERIAIGDKLDSLAERREPLEIEQSVLSRAEDALRSAEERQRAFELAFESGDHTAVYGGGLGPADPAEAATGFGSMRGRLPFPFTGRSEIRSGRRKGADGPGLEMRAARGTPVRAVFGGRVAFADSYADYGKTVIVDHGRHHYTVSSNLGSIDVRAGDELSTGSLLGTIGEAPGGGLLYFEIRVGKDTVDPAEWFGI
jgi:murein DD-endopeptidase MepM/ murein hydrolase activator NlpD